MIKKDKYYVAIEETRMRVIDVDAISEQDAIKKASRIYKSHKNFLGHPKSIHSHTFRAYKSPKIINNHESK